MRICKYSDDRLEEWNSFVEKSKNATFLFNRGFMDYHTDKFTDHSLLIYNKKDELTALFPANEVESEIISHGGLTYGGILMSYDIKTSDLISVTEEIINYYSKFSKKEIIYKAIPYIYHKAPADEDMYALFRLGATLRRRDISQVIYADEKIKFSKGRKWMMSKARKAELNISRSYDFKRFMQIEIDTLKRYGVKPVHTAEEIQLLATRFPENIKLYIAQIDQNEMLAGVLIFETSTLLHTQYIASTDDGKDVGATEFIIDYLLKNQMKDKKYFDFGISTEKRGTYLNEGLTAFKESFGARGVAYDFYAIDL
jgi:hypothetical protein